MLLYSHVQQNCNTPGSLLILVFFFHLFISFQEDLNQEFRLIKTCLDGTQSDVRIANYLPSSFSIENCFKQTGDLSPLLYNFALEYATRKVQETNLGLYMNGTHQVLAYADDVNLIGDDIRTIERNADAYKEN